jgi:hypothetical protein
MNMAIKRREKTVYSWKEEAYLAFRYGWLKAVEWQQFLLGRWKRKIQGEGQIEWNFIELRPAFLSTKFFPLSDQVVCFDLTLNFSCVHLELYTWFSTKNILVRERVWMWRKRGRRAHGACLIPTGIGDIYTSLVGSSSGVKRKHVEIHIMCENRSLENARLCSLHHICTRFPINVRGEIDSEVKRWELRCLSTDSKKSLNSKVSSRINENSWCSVDESTAEDILGGGQHLSQYTIRRLPLTGASLHLTNWR